MKIKIYRAVLMLILIALLPSVSYAQTRIAYYDAIILNNLFDSLQTRIPAQKIPLTNSIVNKILKGYSTNPDIAATIATNPFLSKYFAGGASASLNAENIKALNSIASSTLSSVSTGLSGIDVTKYAQVTADFLAERIKEELTLAFIDKFRSTIDTIPEIKALLPKTHQVFTTSDPFKIPSLGKTYKTAFIQDMQRMIYNFEIFVKTNAKYKSIKNSPEFLSFMASYRAADLASKGYHLAEVFKELDIYYGDSSKAVPENNLGRKGKQDYVTVNNLLQLINMFSESLRDTSAKEAWIKREDFVKLSVDARKIYFGLLYEKNKALFENTVMDSISLIKGTTGLINPENIEKTDRIMKQFLWVFNNIDKQVNEYEKITKDLTIDAKIRREQVLEAFTRNSENLIETIDIAVKMCYLGKDSLYENSKFYIKIKPALYDVSAISNGLYEKDYAKVTLNSIAFINSVTISTSESSLPYTQLALRNKKLIQHLTTITSFMVDIINADSSQAIKEVLKRYADPVSSYKVKRYSPNSISINAYPGLYVGWEYDLKHNNTKAAAFGVTAPIGISINRGVSFCSEKIKKSKENKIKNTRINNDHFFYRNNKLKYYKGVSSSLFLSVVDIGAVLSYRWNKDTLDLPQKITLGQLFSPGIFYVYGIKNTPLAFKIGGQYAPLLRSVTSNGNTYTTGTWRISATLSVDIPVLHLYRKE